jgi:hypothetical protein
MQEATAELQAMSRIMVQPVCSTCLTEASPMGHRLGGAKIWGSNPLEQGKKHGRIKVVGLNPISSSLKSIALTSPLL